MSMPNYNELFEKLKDALDYKYLITDFGATEVTNLEEYIRAIKTERTLEKKEAMLNNENSNYKLNTYREFIHYLNEKAIGKLDSIIETFDNNEFNHFVGYLKTKKIIMDNKIYLKFEVAGRELFADWQASDNYGVWQTCGICGDDYSGYLLFPTYNEDEYFCLEYRC